MSRATRFQSFSLPFSHWSCSRRVHSCFYSSRVYSWVLVFLVKVFTSTLSLIEILQQFVRLGAQFNICEWVTCSNGGICQPAANTTAGYRCRCQFGFSGLLCEDRVNITSELRWLSQRTWRKERFFQLVWRIPVKMGAIAQLTAIDKRFALVRHDSLAFDVRMSSQIRPVEWKSERGVLFNI